MHYLRACAAYGCAVVILHHPAKAEGSTGRGSSAIRGACDLAFLHTLDRESGLITLKVDKNRLGASRTITVKADFEEAKFELAEAPYVTRRNDELERLEQVIKDNPGITQNAISKQSGMMKARLVRLLKEGTGIRWRTENGRYGATCYFASNTAKSLFSKDGTTIDVEKSAISTSCSTTCSDVPNSLFPKDGTARTGNPKPISEQTCSPVLSPLGENREQVCEGAQKNLSSCPHCGGFAIYLQTDGKHTCMTCKQTW
jgi:hypothetical protein